MNNEDIVAAAQRGEPVADWLEERIEQQVRLDCAVKIRSHDEAVRHG